jgi:hypothetical protein
MMSKTPELLSNTIPMKVGNLKTVIYLTADLVEEAEDSMEELTGA